MGLHRRCFWLGLPMVLCGAVRAAALPAQSAPEQPAPPVFGADVTLVAVPVFVTDKSGTAVAGLTAEDFEVYDGGRRVPIAAFQAVDVHGPVAAAAQPELPVAVQAAAHRQFLLLFDLQFSPAAGITRARAAATRFVRDSLGAGDLVAVATFGRGGLEVLTNFTSDHDSVARAIEGLGLVQSVSSDPLGLSSEFAVPAGESRSERAALADQALAEQVGYLRADLARGYANRIVDFLAGVKELAQALSTLRGRKQIVLLSGGFAESVWTPNPRGMAPDPKDFVVRRRMAEVFRMAAESDVVIHSIDVGGLEGAVDVSSWDGRSPGTGAGRGALAALAENTGGRFILPTNDFARALGEMEQVSRHYYVLAFQPAEPVAQRGRPRSLKVRVHGAGRSVTHRAAYVVPASPVGSDAAAIRSAAAEAIGKGLSGGPLGLRLVAMPYRDGEGGRSVPAVLHIDGPALGAVAAQGEKLDLQVYGYAMAAGRVLDTLTLETTLELSKLGASVRSDGVRVLTAFAVSPGAVELRFFVRAGASGEIGSIRRHLEGPATGEGETMLSPPVLMLPPTGRIAIPLPTRGGPQLEIPFRVGSAAFVPDAVALEPGRARELCVFVRRARTGSGDPLEVTGEIARPGEAPLPLRIEGVPQVVPDADGFDRYVVTVVAPQATPGTYALRLTFRDAGTELTARSETPIVIEKPR